MKLLNLKCGVMNLTQQVVILIVTYNVLTLLTKVTSFTKVHI